MAERYDRIGIGYAGRRRPDPRWEKRTVEALGPGRSVINAGAGSGSYDPVDRLVVAVEPSQVMIAQRPDDRAPAFEASPRRCQYLTGPSTRRWRCSPHTTSQTPRRAWPNSAG